LLYFTRFWVDDAAVAVEVCPADELAAMVGLGGRLFGALEGLPAICDGPANF